MIAHSSPEWAVFLQNVHSRPFPSLYVSMNLHMIIFGGNDAFLLRSGEAVVVDPLDKQNSTTTHIVPEKFREDVAALTKYVGEARFKSGLTIEVTLAELLNVVPRNRRRTDAYSLLVKYLKDECQITLTIKSSKS